MPKVYPEDMFPLCPEEDYICPYFNGENGHCMMYAETNDFPQKECDAFFDWDED